MEQYKRRCGDRKDGCLLRGADSLHFITGIIYPNRCDNEAYISERIDLTAINAYLAKKNETETDFPYTMFHLIVTALLKTITLRPNGTASSSRNFYQRNEQCPPRGEEAVLRQGRGGAGGAGTAGRTTRWRTSTRTSASR